MSVSMAGMKNSEIVIGEGITEKFYILSLLDTVKIKPTPIIVKPYNMDELDKAIKHHAIEGRTAIHCLIDMDNKVNNDSNMSKYKKLKQKYDGKTVKGTDCFVRFYESLPSIEQFLYYYFEYSNAVKTNDGLKSWLHHKSGYEVSEKWFKGHSIHNTLIKSGGCLNNAIINAKNSVRHRPNGSYNYSYTEVGEFIEHLGVK